MPQGAREQRTTGRAKLSSSRNTADITDTADITAQQELRPPVVGSLVWRAWKLGPSGCGRLFDERHLDVGGKRTMGGLFRQLDADDGSSRSSIGGDPNRAVI